MSAIFNPPLSTQRYCWVQDFLSSDPNIKSVTDVGCAQGRMIIWLKHVANLELVNCIDQSLPTLEDGIEPCFQPNLYEMLFGRQNSEKQLDIRVFHGDIVVPDDRLKADCFTMVELIEHIPLDHLEKVCQTVFGYYNPQFVVVTTPNCEFNPLLNAHAAQQRAKREQERLRSETEDSGSQIPTPISSQSSDTQQQVQSPPVAKGNNKFRHHDHKFEWTRAEFSQWTDLMCRKYSYDVVKSGVGELPGSEPYGPCTQIALFKRQEKPQQEAAASQADPMLCFDLLLNKLSVEEEKPEFLGDPTLRTVCLRAQYHVPGTSLAKKQETTHFARWSDEEMEESNGDWSNLVAETRQHV